MPSDLRCVAESHQLHVVLLNPINDNADDQEKRNEYVGPLEPAKEDIKQDPYTLPEGFIWDTVDVLDDEQACPCDFVSICKYFAIIYLCRCNERIGGRLAGGIDILTTCVCMLQLEDLYQLLNENYVEDDDNMFRFDYSKAFLKWYVSHSHMVGFAIAI